MKFWNPCYRSENKKSSLLLRLCFYNFQQLNSYVKIRFTETMPATAWNKMAPSEYGFYANVNPGVAQPRWSQSRERILGASIFTPKA
jgi:sulfoxide reductase catalytic subunit YedY